jgi:serine/threonine-protein kinase
MTQPSAPVVFMPNQPDPTANTRQTPQKAADDKTQVIKPVTEAAAKETAQKKKRQPKERDYVDREISRGRIATAAVITLSIAVVVAVLIFLSLLLRGGETVPEIQRVEVPNLVGIDFEFVPKYDDLKVVMQLQTYSDEYGAGKIIDQRPEGGEMVDKGRTIYVTVSLGPKPEDVKLKDLVGQPKTDAHSYLDSLGLDINVTFAPDEYHDTIPAGSIIKTDPAAGQVLRKGQKVTLTVSLGREKVLANMPDLLRGGDMTRTDAESLLNIYGFTNIEWRPVNSLLPKDYIVSQSVEPTTKTGKQIDVTTHIIIEYSNGIPPEKQPVTIQYTIEGLPVSEENCTVSLFADGKVVASVEMAAGETSVMVTLTGKGQKEYLIFIDGVGYRTITVDFDAYDE